MRYSAKAYAKINLYLDVVGKRPDGYHDLDTIMQNISLYDEISLELTDGEISVCCDNETICDSDNIAFAACRTFFDYTKIKKGARIHIKKHIPLAAGVGGGSSDAAAVLSLLNIATDAQLSEDELIKLATPLGADVPFFIIGGTARAQGIGERLEKIVAPKMHYVLLKNGIKQSTGQMYAKLDSTDYEVSGDIEGLIENLSDGDIIKSSSNLFNAFIYCWDFESLCKPFSTFVPLTVFLSGSGPTVCALFTDIDKAQECADALKSDDYDAFCVSSVDYGMEIV